MLRLFRRTIAAGLALALPWLTAAGGLVAGAPVSGLSAQEAGQTSEAGGRKGRRARREQAEKTPAVPPGMQHAAPLATFGDWNVFTNGQGRSRVCYVIAQPQSRVPKTLARDTAYLFVTIRKSENVQNEVAVMFGFKPKPAASQVKPGSAPAPSDPYLTVGSTRFGLVVKDENAWVQNQNEETRIVADMGTTEKAVVRTTSGRGSQTTDAYALAGFADAMKRAREECK